MKRIISVLVEKDSGGLIRIISLFTRGKGLKVSQLHTVI